MICIGFCQKWVGLHFERFFHKLIWSPWLPTNQLSLYRTNLCQFLANKGISYVNAIWFKNKLFPLTSFGSPYIFSFNCNLVLCIFLFERLKSTDVNTDMPVHLHMHMLTYVPNVNDCCAIRIFALRLFTQLSRKTLTHM
jgi:hypothetical protein